MGAGSFLISGFISDRSNHLEKFLTALRSRYNPGEACKGYQRAVIMKYYFTTVHFRTVSGHFQRNRGGFTSDNLVFISARLWKTFPRLIRLSKENPRLGNTYSLWSFLKTFLNCWATDTGLWSAAETANAIWNLDSTCVWSHSSSYWSDWHVDKCDTGARSP